MDIELVTKDNKVLLEDGHMTIFKNPTQDLINNLLEEMKVKNIKRLIFTCNKLLEGFYNIREIKDIKVYYKTNGIFKEYIMEGQVYQLYNPEGKKFINGPFQRCKICRNWFKITESESEFLKEKGLEITKTCKRCKGRKVVC